MFLDFTISSVFSFQTKLSNPQATKPIVPSITKFQRLEI